MKEEPSGDYAMDIADGDTRGAPNGSSSQLGKRPREWQERAGRQVAERQAAAAATHSREGMDGGPVHFRMLVDKAKAGGVIGKGGDFIQLTRQMTGAKVSVDRLLPDAEERIVHVISRDEPDKPLSGLQDAVLRTAERILGDEGGDGAVKLPSRCQLRVLLFKFQVGHIMGRKGSVITDLRTKSGAGIKLISPALELGRVVAPGAEADDELLLVSGNAEEVMTALKLVTDKLRCVPVPLDRHGQRVDGRDHFDRERGRRDDRGDKRTRGDDSGRYDPPPHAGVHAPLDQGGAAAMAAAAAAAAAAAGGAHMHHDPHGPPANALAVALPPHVRGVLDDNDSVKVEGLSGLATVEYRLLVPIKRSGVVLGHRGGFINEVRDRTGAAVQLFDEVEKAGTRVLQIMSTEGVQDQRCAAFDAAMDFTAALVRDELLHEPAATVRLILPHGQVGAVMGKGGKTIRELRAQTGASLFISGHPNVPRGVKKGEEVLELVGQRDAVLLATHIVLVAVRGNMARGQLVFNYALPPGAPPPTLPRHAPPYTDRGGGGGGGPRLGGGPGGRPSRGSRWDSDAPGQHDGPQGLPLPLGAGLLPAHQHPQQGAHAPHMQQVVGGGQALPPGAVVYGGLPQQGLAPPPHQQVQYAHAPLPGQPPQVLPPGATVQYVQAAPPPSGVMQQPQQQQPGGPQQVLVYSTPGGQQVVAGGGAPLPGAYAVPGQQQVLLQQQQPPPGQPAQQLPGQPQLQQVLEYVQQQAGGAMYAVSGPPSSQQLQQAAPPSSGPMLVYQPQPVAPQQPPQYVGSDPGGVPLQQQHMIQQRAAQQLQQQAVATSAGMQPGQQQVTYVYASEPQQQQVQLAQPPGVAATAVPSPQPAPPSGPSSMQGGFSGLASLLASAVAAAAPPAAAPVSAPSAQQPQQQAAPPPAPKARVLLTQDQVVRLRLEDPSQLRQLSMLSGAVITLSEHALDSGAREVLLAGSDAQCNTATNLMEALMKSS